jgi:hypothetical protein
MDSFSDGKETSPTPCGRAAEALRSNVLVFHAGAIKGAFPQIVR